MKKNTTRIGINGFGRIGRMVLRASIENPNTEIVAINDLIEIDYLVYLLKYDSTHGKIKCDIRIVDNYIVIGDNKIRVTNFSNIEDINWSDVQAEYIVESTGRNLTSELANKHIKSGAKKVVMSAPSKDTTPMFVMGVNEDEYSPEMNIVSNASCTTNCLAPMVKILDDNYGIESGLMTTIHAVTSTQASIDSFSGSNWRIGRGAFQNIIPSSTGAAKALDRVIPNVKGKLTGMSFRVPVANVSVVDLTVNLATSTSYKEICETFKSASESERMKGILGYSEDELVSSDIISDKRISIIDASAGIELNDKFMKIVSWYDNEYAYAFKLLDLISYMSKMDSK